MSSRPALPAYCPPVRFYVRLQQEPWDPQGFLLNLKAHAGCGTRAIALAGSRASLRLWL
jgi:hypothetical protein